MKLSLEKMIVVAIGPALTMLVVIGIVSFRSIRELSETADWVNHTQKTIQSLENLQSRLTEARLVERGYVITGESRNLEPYFNSIYSELKDVKELTYETPIQFPRFESLKIHVAALRKTFDHLAELRRDKGFNAAIEEINAGEGKEDVDNALAIIGEMEVTEKDLLQQRDNDAKAAVQKTVYVIVLGSVLAFALTGTSSFVIYRNIAERNRARQQLEQLNKQLQSTNRELQSIIGVASHDLRSPLVNIKGFGSEIQKDIETLNSMLKNASFEAAARQKIETIIEKYIPESLGFIQNSAATMDQLLKALLQVARAGLAELKIVQLDMNTIIASITKNLEFKMKEASAEFTIGPLPKCSGDRTQITQVFTNLIDNAIKYRHPSHACRIRLSGSIHNNQIVYCIEDNGLGVPAQQQDKIFDLFYRINPDDAKGDGVGLSIVKRIVERHNGRIWVESQENGGSKFFISLPN